MKFGQATSSLQAASSTKRGVGSASPKRRRTNPKTNNSTLTSLSHYATSFTPVSTWDPERTLVTTHYLSSENEHCAVTCGNNMV